LRLTLDTFSPGTTADQPPQANDAKCGVACHTIVKDKDYVSRSTGTADGQNVQPILARRTRKLPRPLRGFFVALRHAAAGCVADADTVIPAPASSGSGGILARAASSINRLRPRVSCLALNNRRELSATLRVRV
jgi:hypothetical protein